MINLGGTRRTVCPSSSMLRAQYAELAQASMPTTHAGKKGEKGDYLMPLERSPQNDFSFGVDTMELEGILCQINTDDGSCFHGWPPS